MHSAEGSGCTQEGRVLGGTTLCCLRSGERISGCQGGVSTPFAMNWRYILLVSLREYGMP